MSSFALDEDEPYVSKHPNDGKEFNDPTAWGYCEQCAFEVAVYDGVRVEHRFTRNGNDTSLCTGGGKPPKREAPAHATALHQISLVKQGGRADRRAYWQRRRWVARNIEGRATMYLGPLTWAEAEADDSPAIPLEDCDVD